MVAIHENWGDSGAWSGIPNHHWHERLKPFLDHYLPLNPRP
jgi:hypothetical protein